MVDNATLHMASHQQHFKNANFFFISKTKMTPSRILATFPIIHNWTLSLKSGYGKDKKTAHQISLEDGSDSRYFRLRARNDTPY